MTAGGTWLLNPGLLGGRETVRVDLLSQGRILVPGDQIQHRTLGLSAAAVRGAAGQGRRQDDEQQKEKTHANHACPRGDLAANVPLRPRETNEVGRRHRFFLFRRRAPPGGGSRLAGRGLRRRHETGRRAALRGARRATARQRKGQNGCRNQPLGGSALTKTSQLRDHGGRPTLKENSSTRLRPSTSGKGGQSPFAGTARRVLRTNGGCPHFPSPLFPGRGGDRSGGGVSQKKRPMSREIFSK